MNKTQKSQLIAYAKEGCKIVALIDDKKTTLWAGLGNRSGLHSFAYTLINEAYEKKSPRFLKRLDKLPSKATVEVYAYQNKTRDSGGWKLIDTISVVDD